MLVLPLQAPHCHGPIWDLSGPLGDGEELPQDTEFSSRDEIQSK